MSVFARLPTLVRQHPSRARPHQSQKLIPTSDTRHTETRRALTDESAFLTRGCRCHPQAVIYCPFVSPKTCGAHRAREGKMNIVPARERPGVSPHAHVVYAFARSRRRWRQRLVSCRLVVPHLIDPNISSARAKKAGASNILCNFFQLPSAARLLVRASCLRLNHGRPLNLRTHSRIVFLFVSSCKRVLA